MGLFSWISTKTTNSASRAKNFVRRISSADEIEKNGEFIVGMIKDLSSKPENARQETFASAYQRLNLTEERLAETYNYYGLRFNIFLFFFIIGVFLCGWYTFQMSFAALAVLGFLAFCLGHLFVASFRMLQIRRRELLPVSYWLSVPREWWPRPFVPAGRSGGGHDRSRRLSSSDKRISSSDKVPRRRD